ncbi:hypothetical protein PV08_07042 [Exophiala spinifera]|uniref:Uncharacterized protein n=1 Tax=Exophiala spinifera TaxID=91928 RepID=A0A0D2B6E1_9EURO|nr:uncharacterized protein PV08_07042 [Exophiala spinifera]KIW14260.1 hypothetical protein PV08_07042 [Exophiala spinifera]
MDVGETSTTNGSNNGTEQTTTTPELTSDSEEEEAIVVEPEVLEAAAVEGGMLYTMTATNTTDNAASGHAGEQADAEADAEAEAGVEGEEDKQQEEEVPIHEAIMTSNTYLTIAAITADQQAAFEDNDLVLHFQPGIEPPILGFDPRVVQDDFDPFDLDFSGLIDFNTNMSE